MGLGDSTILYWDVMRKTFLRKYQLYCQSWSAKEDNFKMSRQEHENLKDYL